MNLSLTELIIASSGNSILAFNSFQKRWTLSSGACQVNAFGMTYLGIQSIVTLSVLALQRCMMVTRDRQFPLSTINSTLLTLFFIWTYSFLVSFPPILGFGTFSQNTLGVSCGVKWMGTGEDHAMNITYVFYIYMFGFIVPLTIIFTCYLKIIKTIKLKSQQTQTAANQSSRQARDRKLTIMVAVMLLSFICCWFPYACVSIAETAGYTPKSTYSFYILAIPTMLSKTSVCVNPIIYFWLNPQFRGELSQWWGRGAVTPGSTSTTRTTRMQVNREHGSRPKTDSHDSELAETRRGVALSQVNHNAKGDECSPLITECSPGPKQKRSFSTHSFRNLTKGVVRSQSLQIPLCLSTAADEDTTEEQTVEISIESKVVLFTKHVLKK